MIIKFDVLDNTDVTGLEQGYVTIIASRCILCSKKKSSMIFVCIPLFLNGIVRLLTTNLRECEFPAVSSSFQFEIIKINKKMVKVIHEKKVLERMSNEELIKCVWNATVEILSKYPHLLTEPDEYETALDLNTCLENFRTAFGPRGMEMI